MIKSATFCSLEYWNAAVHVMLPNFLICTAISGAWKDLTWSRIVYNSTHYPPYVRAPLQHTVAVNTVTTLASAVADNSALQPQHKLLVEQCECLLVFFFSPQYSIFCSPAVLLLSRFHPLTLGFSWSYFWHRNLKSCILIMCNRYFCSNAISNSVPCNCKRGRITIHWMCRARRADDKQAYLRAMCDNRADSRRISGWFVSPCQWSTLVNYHHTAVCAHNCSWSAPFHLCIWLTP